MGNESHDDGVKAGAKGKIDTSRCWGDKDYEKGTVEGQGIRDGTRGEENVFRVDWDKNYAKGVRIGEKLQDKSGGSDSGWDSSDRDEMPSRHRETSPSTPSQKGWALLAIITGSLSAVFESGLAQTAEINGNNPWAFWIKGLSALVIIIMLFVIVIRAYALLRWFFGFLAHLLNVVIFGIGLILIHQFSDVISIPPAVYGVAILMSVIVSIIFLIRSLE